MAEGGYENAAYDLHDPSLDDRNEDNNDNNDQDANETTPFWRESASTPGPPGEEIPIQTMQHEQSGLPEGSYVEPPSFEGFFPQEERPAIIERAK